MRVETDVWRGEVEKGEGGGVRVESEGGYTSAGYKLIISEITVHNTKLGFTGTKLSMGCSQTAVSYRAGPKHAIMATTR